MPQLTRLRSKVSTIVCATILATTVSASAKEGETRTCETKLGGQVVCGDLVIGLTLEQYEAGLKRRAEEIRAEETEKRVQLQKLMEMTQRATSAEKDSLRGQVAAVEADKRALEAESKGVSDRLTNLQASYDGLVQKLAEANAALEAFAPLISKDAFAQAQAMLSRGDVLGAERKFVEIADAVGRIREKASVLEARAAFEAGKLAEQRIDWRAASTHYARAARLQPSNWQYSQEAGNLAHMMGDYVTAASFQEAALALVTSAFGPDARETGTASNDLATTYMILMRSRQAESLYRRSIEIAEKVLSKDHPNIATGYSNLAILLQNQGKYDQAESLQRRALEISERNHHNLGRAYHNLASVLHEQRKYDQAGPLYRKAIEIDERTLGKDDPFVAVDYQNLASLLKDQGKGEQAEPLYRRAIEIYEKVLGKDHPIVAAGYKSLADLLRDHGNYDQADPLYNRGLEIFQTKLGLDHRATVAVREDYDRLQKLRKQSSRKPAR
jgi:tetratricopeptide (TPR) repeat protein